jgi:5,10-methylene-tetrahydrofolate dehydrogenase/methenyl tetrahydrofolate cyclohydrolase
LLKNPDGSYYTIRCQRRRITSTIKKYNSKFDSDNQPEELLRFNYNPNSINLVNRIKEQLNKKIVINGNNIELTDKISEKRFLKKINKINEDKINVPN